VTDIRPDLDRPTPSGPGDHAPADGPAPELPTGLSRERRPHPLTPFIRGWIVLLGILFYVGREFVPDGQGEPFENLPPVPVIVAALVGIVLLAGLGSFVTWWFTRYVIDADELRIETGMLTKRSRRIGFNRIQSIDLIQPLGARIFSLAELRIEAGSGDGIKIRYLPRADAARLRDYLLARAAGENADVESASDADAFSDRSSRDTVITTIGPGQLVGGFLLSHELLGGLLITGIVLGVGAALEVVVFTLPVLFPMLFGTVSLLMRRVIAQFNFSLAETGRGLRITRGLTNLTSQSLPVDRIQGIRIRQPLLWRITGWYRVDVDVLGYGGNDEEGNKQDASSLMLPVATGDQVRAALLAALPGTDHEAIPLTPIPRRANWLRWWNARTIAYGVDEHLAVMTIGWLTARRDLVPHAKTQSVQLSQGPWQRRLRLATWNIHTTRGPVNWVTPSMDADQARRLGLDQVDRARAARAAAAVRAGNDHDHPDPWRRPDGPAMITTPPWSPAGSDQLR